MEGKVEHLSRLSGQDRVNVSPTLFAGQINSGVSKRRPQGATIQLVVLTHQVDCGRTENPPSWIVALENRNWRPLQGLNIFFVEVSNCLKKKKRKKNLLQICY